MKNILTILLCMVAVVFLTTAMIGQDAFQRAATIDADTLDIGGYGHTVSGLDIDGDGKLEIYAVNTDWHDVSGYDLVPRIYKYEQVTAGDPTAWQTVWSTRLSMDYQNTWAPLDHGDLDGDGREEIIWGPVNNTAGGLNPVPDRIVVFETPGDGSDNMGVDNGDGTWRPNARWEISTTPNDNVRPFKWIVTDIDNDGDQEIVSSLRVGPGMEIYSVDDVPDAADSSETWTTEFSGLSGVHYDIAVIGNIAYDISSGGDVTAVVATGPDTYVPGTTQVGLVPGGSWKSAATVDVDGDTQEEIIIAENGSGSRDVLLLQQSGDSLISNVIGSAPATSGRLYGGDAGDLDDDGGLDYVFGTRDAAPNGLIHRLEYQSGDITDPNNWELTNIDSLISSTAVQYDIINVANLDGDAEDEVVYTGTPRGNSASDTPQPIVILDRVPTGIGNGRVANLLDGFDLQQNYPNPFNPETQISFTIPQALMVSLKIYNITGQEVRTLVNENRSAGTHTVRWDGSNNQGIKVGSGVYVYTIRAGKFLQSKKMTFMK